MEGMKSHPPAPTPKPAVPPPRATVSAVEMGARQREISVSEFFTKNRHLLGFDSPRKALLTCVKEAVDNALDACEEAGILPDVVVKVEAVANGEAPPPASQASRFRITVSDNARPLLRGPDRYQEERAADSGEEADRLGVPAWNPGDHGS